MRTRKVPPPLVPDPPYWPLGHRFTLLVVFASVLMVAPLWAVRDLPMVDMPQHLDVLDVLARLRDPAVVPESWADHHHRSLVRAGTFTLLLRQAEPTDSIPMRHEAP